MHFKVTFLMKNCIFCLGNRVNSVDDKTLMIRESEYTYVGTYDF